MARIRSIHPSACTSEKIASLTGDEERCWWRLQTHCDDHGKAEDHPRLIWAALFPLNEDVYPDDVDRWLTGIEDAGLIVRYEIDGKRYLSVIGWSEKQSPRHPSPSKFPDPPRSYGETPRGDREAPYGDGQTCQGEGVGGVNRELTGQSFSTDFADWWDGYPRKVQKQDALKAYRARRREGIDPERLTHARDAYAHSRRGEDPTYTMHGSTFLAKDGPWSEWEDGPPEVLPIDSSPAPVFPMTPMAAEPRLVLPRPRVETCPVCESSLLACECPKEATA